MGGHLCPLAVSALRRLLDLLLLDLDELLLKLLNDSLKLLLFGLLLLVNLFQLRKLLLLFLKLLFVNIQVQLVAVFLLTGGNIELLDLVKVLLQILALLLEQ